MHVKIRLSSTKSRKMTGFRRRMRTKHGRKIINNQRAVAAGRPKANRRFKNGGYKRA